VSSTITAVELESIAERTADIIKSGVPTLIPGLALLTLKGKPYTLEHHFQFEPMFRLDVPRKQIWKCCRQVGKTQNLAASRLLKSVSVNYYNMLLVCPRFEQIKRVSNSYMKPLIYDSDFKDLFLGDEPEESMLQRSFWNRSTQFYSFAFLDAERIRSISANENVIDEVQDINWDFVPIIAETMSGSPRWRNQLYTGTPKTFENTIEKLWIRSSMAEWCIRCGCGKWNIGALDQDLLQMIGATTCICAKCGKTLDTRTGVYVHRFPERRPVFEGYHISQVVHPIHAQFPANWKDLLDKQKNYTQTKFHNECLGETADSSTRLMTLGALKDVSMTEYTNTIETAVRRYKGYTMVTCGIDWTGGGDATESYTAIAFTGQRPGSDIVECFYVERLNRNMTTTEELARLLELIKRFNPLFIAHDYGGAGNMREHIMIQAGIPAAKIIPYTYVFSPTKAVITFSEAKKGTRSSFSIDKSRSLFILCSMIKAHKVFLPEFNTSEECVMDFLNLTQEHMERMRGNDIVYVSKAADTADDVVHAINYACSCIWYTQQRYPDVAQAMKLVLTQEEINRIAPDKPNWMSR